MKKLYIIDASSLLFRSFYAQPNLVNSKGISTGALYGFAKMLISFLVTDSVEYIISVFDSGKKNFRHDLYDQYKQNRSSTPPELSDQLKRSREIVEALSIQFLDITGYEADDVIATLCKKYEDHCECIIISSDKDLMQLVNSKTVMYDSMKKITYNCKNVKKKLLVEPNQVIDYLSLVGDVSDNIPGVKSIGPKTAVELLSKFKSLKNIYKNIDNIEKPRTVKLLIEGKEQAFLSQKLVTLYDKIDIGNFELQQWSLKDLTNTQKILSFYEFESIYDKINILQMKYSAREIIPQEVKLETLVKKKRFIEWISIAVEKNDLFSIDSNIFQKDQFVLTKTNDILIQILSFSHIEKIGVNIKQIWHLLHKYNLQKSFFIGWHDLMVLNYSTSIGKENTYFKDSDEFYKSIGHYQKYNALNLYDTFNKLRYKNKYQYHFYEYIDRPYIKVLFDMEKAGIKIDVKTLNEISNEIEKELSQLKEQIFKESKIEFDINSPKQLSNILFEHMQITPIKKNTKSGIYSTNVDVLMQLASMNHNIAHLLLQWRHLSKLKNTYSDPLASSCDENFRIHSTFLSTFTNTGRLSSLNPNLQNIPRGPIIRQAFISDKNKSFIIADYSQIELRILSYIANITQMNEAFKNDEDIHSETAKSIFQDNSKENRNKAKAINFGIIYGMGTYGLAQQLKISLYDAKQYLAKYNAQYTEIQPFMEKVIQKNKEKGFIKNIFNRHISINMEQSNWERIAMNAPMQSSVADIMKLSMNRISQRLINGKILLQIHDEIIVESDDNNLIQNKKIIEEEMINIKKYFNLSLNLKINTSVKKSLV